MISQNTSIGFLILVCAYQGGLLCHVEELLRSFVVALDVVNEDEENIIGQVSPEEWDAISPTKYKRRSVLLDLMSVRIYTYTYISLPILALCVFVSSKYLAIITDRASVA
jgi:hypothetical protein